MFRANTRREPRRSGGTDCSRTPKARIPGRSRRLCRITSAAQRIDLLTPGGIAERTAHSDIARVESNPEDPSVRWSLRNRLPMVLHGTADARGFLQRTQVGRAPVKGSRTFHILGPSMVKQKETGAAGREVERSILVGLHTVPVFRVEDTDGEAPVRPDYTRPVLEGCVG